MTVTMKANRSYKLVVHKKGFGGSGESLLNSSVSLTSLLNKLIESIKDID